MPKPIVTRRLNTKKIREALRGAAEAAQKRNNGTQCSTGIPIERSRCCDAEVTRSRGGVIVEICSKCGKDHGPQRSG